MINEPKILVFDIETYGGLKAHMSEVFCFGYQWLGDHGPAKVISALDFPKEFKRDSTNDRPVLVAASKVFNQADTVVAHYGQKFDRRFLNTRLAKHGLPPLKPVRLEDTWRMAKDNFAMHSNKLDVLLQFFKAPIQKIDLSYDEWRSVMLGDAKALKKLVEHCRNDVGGLEWLVRNPLWPFMKQPNWNLYVEPDSRVCPYCGSDGLRKEGESLTQTQVWQQYSCKSCRKWPKGPKKGSGVIR